MSVAIGDPIPLTYDPTAPYMASLESLTAAYLEASNGEVDLDDVNVTNDQFVAWYQQKTTALARAAALVAAGISTVASGPSLAITDLIQQGAGADAPGCMLFKVTLTNPPTDRPVTVDYTTEDVTAVANADYVPKSGTLTWLPGQTEQTIAVPVIARAEAVPHMLFKVVLSNPSGAGVASSVGVGDILYSHFLSTTTVTSSDTSILYGEDVTFTATVTNDDPAHSPGVGIVHFFDGDEELDKEVLVAGKATLTLHNLAAGSHSITVKYTGWQIPGYSYLKSTSAVRSCSLDLRRQRQLQGKQRRCEHFDQQGECNGRGHTLQCHQRRQAAHGDLQGYRRRNRHLGGGQQRYFEHHTHERRQL